MPNPESKPLVAQLLSPASITMLAQVLGDDSQAQVTGLDAAPLYRVGDLSRYERLRLAWEGPRGSGSRAMVLKGFAPTTWSEAVNPLLPAPAEVLLVESDLPSVFSAVLAEGTIAAGRRTEGRTAWLLSEDGNDFPLLVYSDDNAALALETLARFHVLHWGAQRVLDDVYPWLPRFSEWVRLQCALLATARRGGGANETRYGQWAEGQWGDLMQALPAAWASLPAPSAAVLASLVDAPMWLVEQVAASPQTILQGNYRAAELRLSGGRVAATDWEYLQVGPAAWELYRFLASLPTTESPPTSDAYLARIATHIPELSERDCALFGNALRLAPLLETLLYPPNPAIGAGLEVAYSWLSTLAEQVGAAR